MGQHHMHACTQARTHARMHIPMRAYGKKMEVQKLYLKEAPETRAFNVLSRTLTTVHLLLRVLRGSDHLSSLLLLLSTPSSSEVWA